MPEVETPDPIHEYGTYIRKGMEKQKKEDVELSDQAFDLLLEFVRANETDDETDASPDQLFTRSKRGGQEVITAQKYVGTLTLKDGTPFEILPKLQHVGSKKARLILRDMLWTVSGKVANLPIKLGKSMLVEDDVPIFEVYIRMFLDEVTLLVKRGLKRDYRTDEFNEPFLRGKLIFREQIRRNLCRRDRFYVERDDYLLNRPENRLIRSALHYVYGLCQVEQNRVDCIRLLSSFGEVEDSHDVNQDFRLCAAGRNMTEYDSALQWCRLFLNRSSLNAFRGDFLAFALFFPMQDLYEMYVAEKLRLAMFNEYVEVLLQDNNKSLMDDGSFELIPDIVVKDLQTGAYVILDTKWKVIRKDNSGRLQGVDPDDMRQMYVYSIRYQANRAILIYPRPKEFEMGMELIGESYLGLLKPVRIYAMFFDLLDVEGSLKYLKDAITAGLRD